MRVALLGVGLVGGSVGLAARARLGAEVRGWDPVADAAGVLPPEVVLCPTPLEAVRDADAAVIVTEWNELLSLPSREVRDAMRRPLIVDGRNLLDPKTARDAGFMYEAIGRSAVADPALPEMEPQT